MDPKSTSLKAEVSTSEVLIEGNDMVDGCPCSQVPDAIASLSGSISLVANLSTSIQQLLDLKDTIRTRSREIVETCDDPTQCIWLEDLQVALHGIILKIELYKDACVDLANYGRNAEVVGTSECSVEELKIFFEEIRSFIDIMQKCLSGILDEAEEVKKLFVTPDLKDNTHSPHATREGSGMFGGRMAGLAAWLWRPHTAASDQVNFAGNVNKELLGLQSQVTSEKERLQKISDDSLATCIQNCRGCSKGVHTQLDISKIKESCATLSAQLCN